MGIAFGVVTAILGIAAVLLIFCFRPKRHRHHPPYAKENKFSFNDVESRETSSGRSYFRSLHEQKGTNTPLLQNSTSDTSDLSHDELYKDTELSNHVLFPVPIYGSPPQTSSSRLEVPAHHPVTMQNTASIRPPRSPPPPQSQDSSRPFLSLTIPEFRSLESTIHPLKSPTQGPDSALSRAYADESCDVDGDSPSIYSQPSIYPLSRGPSVSSHVTVRRFSVQPAVLESIIGGGSPIEEDVRHDVNAGSEVGRTISGETMTPAMRVPGLSLPNPHGPDPDNQWQQKQSHLDVTSDAGSEHGRTSPGETAMRNPGLSLPNPHGSDPDSRQQQQSQSYLNRTSGLDRQNTTAVAALLKFRQHRLPPPIPSDVSNIERAGSIRPAFGGIADVVHELGVGRGMGGREPYGRRFRRMKAEQGNSGMAT
jgi:hypothetical protein